MLPAERTKILPDDITEKMDHKGKAYGEKTAYGGQNRADQITAGTWINIGINFLRDKK
jgi:hypothetical protein